MSLLDDNILLLDGNYGENYKNVSDEMDLIITQNLCQIDSIWNSITLYQKEDDIIKVRCAFLWWIIAVNMLNILIYYQVRDVKLLEYYKWKKIKKYWILLDIIGYYWILLDIIGY